MAEIHFVVEQAGCASCAARVREALEPIAVVHEIDVDEAADCAAVRLAYSPDLSQDAVAQALLVASTGARHEYRVQPGSWQSETSP